MMTKHSIVASLLPYTLWLYSLAYTSIGWIAGQPQIDIKDIIKEKFGKITQHNKYILIDFVLTASNRRFWCLKFELSKQDWKFQSIARDNIVKIAELDKIRNWKLEKSWTKIENWTKTENWIKTENWTKIEN